MANSNAKERVKEEREPKREILELDPPLDSKGEDDEFDFTDRKRPSRDDGVKKEGESSPKKKWRDRKYRRTSRSRSKGRATSRRARHGDSRDRRSDSGNFQLVSDSGSDVICMGDKREMENRKRRNRSSRRERSSSLRRRRSPSGDRHRRRRSRRRSRSRKRSRDRSRDRSGERSRRSTRSTRKRSTRSRRSSDRHDRDRRSSRVKSETRDALYVKTEECSNCGKTGHSAMDCTREKVIVTKITTPYDGVRIKSEFDMESRICHNCGEKGHLKTTCKNDQREYRECFNCGEAGHLQMHCENPTKPNPGVVRHAKCFSCGVKGHIKKHCPDIEMGPKCYKCHKFGHIAKACSIDNEKATAGQSTSQGETRQTEENQPNEFSS